MNDLMPFSSDRIAVVAITRHGIVLAGKVIAALPGARLYAPEKFRAEALAAAPNAATCYSGKTGDQVPALFAAFDAIVCIVSLGAVVRLIAPHLKDKEQDPGIVVLDEAGRFAIPLLSGHSGGANALAVHLANLMALTPVLTTASDVRGTLNVDILGRELGWRLEAPKATVTRACAAVVNDEPVAMVQEAGSRAWWPQETQKTPLPANIHLYARIEDVNPDDYAAVLWVSRRPLPTSPALAGKLIAYRPPRVALGLGCDRGTPLDTLQQALAEALALAGATAGDVTAAASIALKRDEPGILALAEIHGWRITFYPAAELAVVAVPHPSETVRRHTGTPSVSEAAALLAAGATQDALIVEKHKLRGADGRNATISIARIPHDPTH